jgi:hypothetical protein
MLTCVLQGRGFENWGLSFGCNNLFRYCFRNPTTTFTQKGDNIFPWPDSYTTRFWKTWKMENQFCVNTKVGEAGIHIYFKSKEAAQSFAEKHGWEYVFITHFNLLHF